MNVDATSAEKLAKLFVRVAGRTMMPKDIEMLAEYVKDSEEKKEKLSKYLDENNLKEYGVIVHSIKSTSATIGVMSVSSKALLLENAAKEGDKDYIALENAAMIREYDKYVALIKGIIPESAIKINDEEVMEFTPHLTR